MKTAVLYARYSSDNQTEQSIEGQVRVCQEYAKQHDILIIGQYIDRAMTGTNDKRPEFQQMLSDSKKKKWDYILVYRFDRFSRDIYDSVIHEQELNKLGIKLISATEIIPETSEGGILKGVIQLMNDYYVKELRQKVKRGMRETRIKGYFQGGTVLYGYKLDGRKLVIDEKEAEVVRFIYEQYSLGVFVKDIMAKLKNQGITFRGRPFARTTIYCILQNDKYIGVYKHEDEVIDNMYPKILDDELFRKVKAKAKKNKYGRKSVKTVYLLRHKIKCGYCGMPVCSETGSTRKGDILHYYKCSGKKRFQSDCIKSNIRKDFLDNLIIDELVKELRKPQNMNTLVDILTNMQNKIDDTNTNLQMLVKEQKQVQNSLNNLVNAIEQGIVSKTTGIRLKELENQLEKLEENIAIERNKCFIKLEKSEIKKYYEDALKKESIILVNYLIKEIVLFNDKIEIKLNSPINKSPDNQGFLFYTKNIEVYNPTLQQKNVLPTNTLIEIYV